MRGLLDTSVLVAIGGTDRPELPDEAAVSTVSLAELHFGVQVAKTAASRAHRLQRLALIESTFTALPVDEPVARAYGELAALNIKAGRKVRTRVVDLLIAATARVHGVPLYTLNRKDFEPFADLIELRGS